MCDITGWGFAKMWGSVRKGWIDEKNSKKKWYHILTSPKNRHRDKFPLIYVLKWLILACIWGPLPPLKIKISKIGLLYVLSWLQNFMTLGRLVASGNDNKQTRFMFYKYRFFTAKGAIILLHNTVECFEYYHWNMRGEKWHFCSRRHLGQLKTRRRPIFSFFIFTDSMAIF